MEKIKKKILLLLLVRKKKCLEKRVFQSVFLLLKFYQLCDYIKFYGNWYIIKLLSTVFAHVSNESCFQKERISSLCTRTCDLYSLVRRFIGKENILLDALLINKIVFLESKIFLKRLVSSFSFF